MTTSTRLRRNYPAFGGIVEVALRGKKNRLSLMAQFYNRQENLSRDGLGKGEKEEIKGKSFLEHYGFTKRDEKKYPVITRILKQLTPDKVKKEIRKVNKIELPTVLQRFINEYKKISLYPRNEYVWKWLFRVANSVILPTVEKKYLKSLINIKFLIFFFTGLLDDVADKRQMQNKQLLNELLKVPFNSNDIEFSWLSKREKKYIKFTLEVFHYIENAIKKYPRYKEFQEIYEYDILQLLNSMRYSYLVNKNPYLINKRECFIYLDHNMTVFINLMVDLMCSLQFKIKDLSIMRQIIWEVQEMMRIANWFATWIREFNEYDLTSGIFANAIDSHVIAIDFLIKNSLLKVISKIKKSGVEKKLLGEWEESYKKLQILKIKVKSPIMKRIFRHLEKISKIILFQHLSSLATMNL